MNPELATREIGWNISYIWLMYVLLAPTVVVAGYGPATDSGAASGSGGAARRSSGSTGLSSGSVW